MDFFQELGLLALGSRLRRLSDQLMASVVDCYRGRDIDFEPRWFPVFRLLVDRGPHAIGEAAAALGMSHAAVSQIAAAMRKRGIVTSTRDPGDERRRVLELTEAGRALVPELEVIWRDLEGAVAEVVDYAGIDLLAALDGIEVALGIEDLYARSEAARRERQRDEVEILDFSPEHRDYFRTLNLEWLNADFEVEEVDRILLANPESVIADGGHIFFARVGGDVVGTVALLRDGDRFELSKMAVTESHRGRQIGKRLLQHALAVARDAGVGSVFLVTNSKLLPAITLYRKVGFRVTHSGPHPKYARGDLTMSLAMDQLA